MVSTLVPPKVASPNAIGGAADAARMQRVVAFYEALPRGPALLPSPRASSRALAHIVGGLIVIGYAQNYYFHLRHHKNNAH
ncbi:putative mitochondrial f1f0 atp synthase subunit f protein [Venturia nashicola]|nr:putative mitochondrial f1f0 atp synthase subunit f protein [Venturia nashicola]